MKSFPHPLETQNPYPAPGSDVTSAKPLSSLVLFRPIEGLQAGDGTNPRAGEDLYLTGAAFRVAWTDGQGASTEIIVPPGFVTDLTSVPPFFRQFVSRAGPWLEAAIVHDYLYVAWQSVPDRGARPADRRFADRIMLAVMKASNVGIVRRTAIFLAVRLGGALGYRRGSTFRFADATDPRLVHLAAVPDLDAGAARKDM